MEATGQGTSRNPGRPLPSARASLGLAGPPAQQASGSLLGASGRQVVLPASLLPGRGVPGGQCEERVGTAVGATAEAGRGPGPWSPPCAPSLPAASGPRPCQPQGSPPGVCGCSALGPDPVRGNQDDSRVSAGCETGAARGGRSPAGQDLALAARGRAPGQHAVLSPGSCLPLGEQVSGACRQLGPVGHTSAQVCPRPRAMAIVSVPGLYVSCQPAPPSWEPQPPTSLCGPSSPPQSPL